MRLAAVLALALAGCVGDPPWHGQTSFTAVERTEIERGYHLVCDRVGKPCDPIAWDRWPDDTSPWTVVRSVDGEGGQYDPATSTIRFRADGVCSPAWLAAHEFGHWLHLPHLTAGEIGVMAITCSSPDATWTEADQLSCKRAGACAVASE